MIVGRYKGDLCISGIGFIVVDMHDDNITIIFNDKISVIEDNIKDDIEITTDTIKLKLNGSDIYKNKIIVSSNKIFINPDSNIIYYIGINGSYIQKASIGDSDNYIKRQGISKNSHLIIKNETILSKIRNGIYANMKFN